LPGVIVNAGFFIDMEPEPFCFNNADRNGDGVINVLDAIGTVFIVAE
jgi:hypothetical protein